MDPEHDLLFPLQPPDKWDLRFLRLAKEIASRSKDPSTKVGAVIVGADRHVVSTGYNGFPKGMDDDPRHYDNRETKLERIIHAEMNALIRANGAGHTIYTWPLASCPRCAVHLIQGGIRRFVSVTQTPKIAERWADPCTRSAKMISQTHGCESVNYDHSLLD
jgi:dCMP deaminase